MQVTNERVVREFHGRTVSVLGGGTLTATNLQFHVENLTVDALGTLKASLSGHPSLGKGMFNGNL